MRKSPKALPTMLRQGDVLLVAVKGGLPHPVPVSRDHGRVVLAYGEVTGHSHGIADEGAVLTVLDHRAEMAEAARALLADVGLTVEVRDEEVVGVLLMPQGGVLVHEEHGAIMLTDERYVVLRQRQYQPAGIQQVAD